MPTLDTTTLAGVAEVARQVSHGPPLYQARKVLEHVTYRPGWTFTVQPGWSMAEAITSPAWLPDDLLILLVHARVPDVHAPVPGQHDVEVARSSQFVWCGPEPFLRMLWGEVKAVEAHEQAEWLRFHGRPLVNPHPPRPDGSGLGSWP